MDLVKKWWNSLKSIQKRSHLEFWLRHSQFDEQQQHWKVNNSGSPTTHWSFKARISVQFSQSFSLSLINNHESVFTQHQPLLILVFIVELTSVVWLKDWWFPSSGKGHLTSLGTQFHWAVETSTDTRANFYHDYHPSASCFLPCFESFNWFFRGLPLISPLEWRW